MGEERKGWDDRNAEQKIWSTIQVTRTSPVRLKIFISTCATVLFAPRCVYFPVGAQHHANLNFMCSTDQ